MGEIKSTLDIIMEKTKGLTLTDEERRKMREEEDTRKVNGLVQRFLDGQIGLDKVKEEMEAVPENRREFFSDAMEKNLLGRLDPMGENGLIFSLLRLLPGADPGALEAEIDRCRKEVEDKRFDVEKRLLEEAAARGIRGSALLPNAEADPAWRGYLRVTRAKFAERVARGNP